MKLARERHIFQFTTSHGGRLAPVISSAKSCAFQFTTSHGGRLMSCPIFCRTCGLSIHDLTRRSTRAPCPRTPTKRFQFTTSHGGRPEGEPVSLEYLVFQFTTSHGGRQPEVQSSNSIHILSIHDLTRRSTSGTR